MNQTHSEPTIGSNTLSMLENQIHQECSLMVDQTHYESNGGSNTSLVYWWIKYTLILLLDQTIISLLAHETHFRSTRESNALSSRLVD